jgi:hypothetical protein
VNGNAGLESVVTPSGPPVTPAAGGAVSTTNARTVSALSLPAVSITFTRSVWAPSASAGSVSGEAQPASAVPSSEHSNAVVSPVKVNVGVASLVGPLGPVISGAGGGPVSTVTVRTAEAPLTFPAASRARTVYG